MIYLYRWMEKYSKRGTMILDIGDESWCLDILRDLDHGRFNTVDVYNELLTLKSHNGTKVNLVFEAENGKLRYYDIVFDTIP